MGAESVPLSEVERRGWAVRLAAEGVSKSEISRRVGRSRQWVHKWLERHRVDGDAGLVDRSRVPVGQPTRLDDATVARVLDVRAELEADPVASIGALSIVATMERQGWPRVPSVASIERILTRQGQTRQSQGRTRTGIKLRLPIVTTPGVWQQADWIHDRWLEGGIRFQSLQAVDVGSGAITSGQYVSRSVVNAVTFAIETAWPVMSIPYAMGTDNAFAKTTHRHNPFTLWIRACLFYGAEAIIAPPRTLGWTNHVEAANNLWQQRTIWARHFATLDELRAGSNEACHWLNHFRPLHDPAIHGTRYPAEMITRHAHQLRWPPGTIADHQDATGRIVIPLTAGRITFLRYVTADHTIDVANATWPVPDRLPVGALITATIATHDHTLTIRYQGEPATTHPYPIPHPITDPYYPPKDHGLLDHL